MKKPKYIYLWSTHTLEHWYVPDVTQVEYIHSKGKSCYIGMKSGARLRIRCKNRIAAKERLEELYYIWKDDEE